VRVAPHTRAREQTAVPPRGSVLCLRAIEKIKGGMLDPAEAAGHVETVARTHRPRAWSSRAFPAILARALGHAFLRRKVTKNLEPGSPKKRDPNRNNSSVANRARLLFSHFKVN
jgi:hypothetical protein